MLSPAEAWELLTIIKHFDGRIVAEEDAGMWSSTIFHALPGATLAQCKAAYAEWQTVEHRTPYVQPSEIIAIVKSHHPAKSITEADIDKMLDPLDLEDGERWQARIALIANANAGMSREQALAKALESARGHLLPAAPPKPKPTNNHHFAGRLRLGDVVGNQEGKTS
jgi:hypothetical protein